MFSLKRSRRAEPPRLWVGLIGPGDCDEDSCEFGLARNIGKELARRNAVVVNGGRQGVMLASAIGASLVGGESHGYLPSFDATEGNEYLTRAIPTGLGEARNFVVVGASQALIAVGDNEGTRIEIDIALKAGKTVFAMLTNYQSPNERFRRLPASMDPVAVVDLALSALEGPVPGSASPTAVHGLGHDQPCEVQQSYDESRMLDSRWRRHDSAQRLYEKDLDLFAVRMNLFLVVVAALTALDLSKAAVDNENIVAALGLSVSACWLLIWISSFAWILKWRQALVESGRDIEDATNQQPPALRVFGSDDEATWLHRWAVNLSRPTGLMCVLPLAFGAYWLTALVTN